MGRPADPCPAPCAPAGLQQNWTGPTMLNDDLEPLRPNGVA